MYAEGGLGKKGAAAAGGAVDKLVLIDGHSLLHRAFFALPPLTAPDGRPTGALVGFFNMLLRLLDDERPSHLAVALDRPEQTFRHAQFDAYKAQRAAMPSELRDQVGLLRELLAALRIPVLEQPGAEADDLIGTAATRAQAAGLPAMVVTGDRDALQLVAPGVTVLYTRRGITEIDRMDVAAVRERYGVEPAQLIDVKALVGDTSDNYPGVPTIGEKTACKLIARFGSAPALLEGLETVGPPRTRQALRDHAETVRRNLRLATIVRDVALAFDVAELRRQVPEPVAQALLQQLGMSRVWGRLTGEGEGEASPVPPAPDAEGIAFHLPPAAVERVLGEDFGARLRDEPGPVGVVVGSGATPTALACAAAGRVWVWEGEGPPPAFDSPALLCAHDSKRVCHVVLVGGGRWRTPAFDASIGAYLLEPDRASYPLRDICRRFAVPVPGDDSLPEAAAALADLRVPLEAALRDNGLWQVYADIELPLVGVLARMERAGVLVDRAALGRLETEFAARLRAAEAEIYTIAGERFNINSTQQLGQILFERLGLKPPKRTKTGYSTDADVLEQLAALHPLPAEVLTYRTLQKLQSTYVQALPGYVAADGRIHTDFRQTVAATGRLSSNNPNLQNIPVRDDSGRPIRRVFVAPPGRQLVSADYSQVELRVLAHLSGDAGLLAAFTQGGDIHRATAAEVWGVPPAEVTATQRSAAKAVNFGIVYGISDFGLARQLGCPVAEAHAVIARYFERYPGVKEHMEAVVAEARRTGEVRTLFGRRRQLPDLAQRNWARRAFAERTAMNSPIQGTAADLIKRAMIAVDAALEARGLQSRLILQVHDELIVEAPDAEVPTVAVLLGRCMRSAGALRVPLEVDVHAGRNWLDMDPVDAAAEGGVSA